MKHLSYSQLNIMIVVRGTPDLYDYVFFAALAT
jgi:hypothetical protein